MSAASSLITTVVFSFVIAVSVTPLMNWFKTRGMPLWLSFILVCLVVVIFMMLLAGVLAVSINSFVNGLPSYQDRISELTRSLGDWLKSMGIDAQPVLSMDEAQASNLLNLFIKFMRQVSQALSAWGFILFLAAFMLIESVDHPAKMQKALNIKNPMPKTILKFNRNIRSYIMINVWIGLLCAALNTILLLILGVDFAVMWGALSFLLSFVPMVGFLISVVPPALMALLEFGLLKSGVVVVGYILINTFTDSIIYPRIVSRGLNLSALTVILSVFFWTWVLGPLGAILSVPMTLLIKELILETSDEAQWLAVLMGPASPEES